MLHKQKLNVARVKAALSLHKTITAAADLAAEEIPRKPFQKAHCPNEGEDSSPVASLNVLLVVPCTTLDHADWSKPGNT